MKVCVGNNFGNSADIYVDGDFESTVKYGKEINGETDVFKTTATLSQRKNTIILYPCDTDNFGIKKQSCAVFDKGKLLGISDMTVSIDGSSYSIGVSGKIYDFHCGKTGIAVGDDLYSFELIKAFTICGAEAVICLKRRIKKSIDSIIVRAYSFLLGVPIILISKDYIFCADPKGNEVENKDGLFELTPLSTYTIKTTKIKFTNER